MLCLVATEHTISKENPPSAYVVGGITSSYPYAFGIQTMPLTPVTELLLSDVLHPNFTAAGIRLVILPNALQLRPDVERAVRAKLALKRKQYNAKLQKEALKVRKMQIKERQQAESKERQAPRQHPSWRAAHHH